MKFLFNDGSGSVREVHSEEELNILINNTSQKQLIRIWLFNSSQWISYNDYLRIQKPSPLKKFQVPLIEESVATEEQNQTAAPRKITKFLTTVKVVVISAAIIGIATVVAFALMKKEWLEPSSAIVYADRPENSPTINTDSLVAVIQETEFRILEKLTKTNLRLRNNWPDKIVLSLAYSKSQNANDNTRFRFDHTTINLENTTGYDLDNAVVEVKVWRLHQNVLTDTFHFAAVRHAIPAVKDTGKEYQGDSISLNFQKIRSYGLNFCYTYDLPSVSGNPNDKWFCKD